jgi:hypothetical protein
VDFQRRSTARLHARCPERAPARHAG